MLLRNDNGTELEVTGCWPATESMASVDAVVNQFASTPPLHYLVCCLSATGCSFEYMEFVATVHDPISNEEYDVYRLHPGWHIG